jgi:predicted DNA-binding antitoxin AbrB/MazE fold protein
MKNLLISISVILLCQYLLTNCANPQAPTGGPKDTIPPTLLETQPAIGTMNFTAEEITLEFDEPVKADRLQSSLIITPRQEIKFKTTTKKNRLIIKFDDPFPDSTTITLNFLEGVTDVTENNPAINLSYVFSTGDFLDSLSISGNTFSLMTANPEKEVTVGLYTLTDSLDLQAHKPTYFFKTDEEGDFTISNIKNGRYRLLAFKDENNNLIFEPKEESFGFLADTIQLDSNITNIDIPLQKQNVSELKLISSRINSHYFDIRYSKSLSEIQTTPNFDYVFDLEKGTLKLYKPVNLQYGDSVQTFLNVKDSLGNAIQDTLYVKFNESSKKKDEFTSTLSPTDKKTLPKLSYQLAFNKPVLTFDSSLIAFVKDSTISIPISRNTQFNWNDNRTLLTFDYKFDTTSYYQLQQELIDSIQSTLPPDTITIDSSQLKKPGNKQPRLNESVKLEFPKNTFISLEQDTLDTIEKSISFYSQKDLGSIILNLTGFDSTDIVQLIDKKFKVIKELPYSPQITLKSVVPGEYGIRVLIDTNHDGIWSAGNLLKNEEPEEVFVYPEFTSLRANWEINLNISKN